PGLDAPGAQEIDARGMIVAPGLVDTHWHMWNTLLRSMSGGVPGEDEPAGPPACGAAGVWGRRRLIPRTVRGNRGKTPARGHVAREKWPGPAQPDPPAGTRVPGERAGTDRKATSMSRHAPASTAPNHRTEALSPSSVASRPTPTVTRPLPAYVTT
ncbi:MAG: hypothetical protein QOG05_4901, partial [Streptosporangiaceae bacterium]|nr:hypothetical protein [Streptosporangiaceae bacterium]